MSVKVLAPVKTYVKIFPTVDDFNSFYNLHKSEIDAQTTYMLNRMYLVQGHRITKVHGELMLKKYDPKTDKRYLSKQEQQDRENNVIDEFREEAASLAASFESTKKEFREELDHLKDDIRAMKDCVNNIIKFLNPTA